MGRSPALPASPPDPPTPKPPPERPAAGRTPAPRRRQIAEALWRIAAERGLHEASLREVAAEAGVSLRAVQ
ncbi:TetR family transcriptional regulator [Streptomyces lydicus]|uniref:TetR family transcriptional regulator n=1 Tax=Streptomyces lydicus TaxID=47763 RepID=UPI00378ADFFD